MKTGRTRRKEEKEPEREERKRSIYERRRGMSNMGIEGKVLTVRPVEVDAEIEKRETASRLLEFEFSRIEDRIDVLKKRKEKIDKKLSLLDREIEFLYEVRERGKGK